MSKYLVFIKGVAGDGTARTIDRIATDLAPIQCSSMRHGIDLPVVSKGSSRTAGYSTHGSIVLRHRLDKATPKLRQTAALGSALGEVHIIRTEMEGGVSVDAETIKLGKARLTAVRMETPVNADGSAPAEMPYELFGLDYEEIVWEWRYKADDETAASTVTGGWDTDDMSTIAAIPAVAAT